MGRVVEQRRGGLSFRRTSLPPLSAAFGVQPLPEQESCGHAFGVVERLKERGMLRRPLVSGLPAYAHIT